MNQKYFNINLNKYGELRQKIEAEKKTFLVTAFSYLTILIIASVLSGMINLDLKTKIKSRSKLLKNIKQEIKTYKISGEFLSKKDLERLARISTERVFWAKKLVAFSEKTTDKIAITHFSFKNERLSLFGITKLDKKQREFDLIDEFITELKNNEQINIDFPKIKFVRSYRDFEKDVEILRFQIDCFAEKYNKKRSRR
ncbi:MAG: hypothetical protein K8R49_09100 [Candidatus Cloacimonetes bacterium]|nr:hypothetical protein [Candidatus Cloacimonadota bacterium]